MSKTYRRKKNKDRKEYCTQEHMYRQNTHAPVCPWCDGYNGRIPSMKDGDVRACQHCGKNFSQTKGIRYTTKREEGYGNEE